MLDSAMLAATNATSLDNQFHHLLVNLFATSVILIRLQYLRDRSFINGHY